MLFRSISFIHLVQIFNVNFYFRTANMVKQFKQRINSCGKLWETVERYWSTFQCLFTHTEGPLTRAAFRCLFDVIWSDEGTNNKEAEEDTMFAWECLLNSVQGKIHPAVIVKLIMLLCTFYCAVWILLWNSI